jgi:hypothetical protein
MSGQRDGASGVEVGTPAPPLRSAPYVDGPCPGNPSSGFATARKSREGNAGKFESHP